MANQMKKVVMITGVLGCLCQQGNEQIMKQSVPAWKALRKQAIVKWPSAKLEAHPTLLEKGMAMGN
jgi:hypothetical protein